MQFSERNIFRKIILPFTLIIALVCINAAASLPVLAAHTVDPIDSDDNYCTYFQDVLNKTIPISNDVETTWLFMGSVYYGGGHCSNIAVDLLIDGTAVQSWEQTGCYHNSDTITVFYLVDLSAGSHTVRLDYSVGDAGVYDNLFIGIPVDEGVMDSANKDLVIANDVERPYLFLGNVYYGGGHCSAVAADLYVDGASVKSWGQSGCYHNSDTLASAHLYTIPAGIHTVRFDHRISDASLYSDSFIYIPFDEGFNSVPSVDEPIVNDTETTWLLMGSIHYGGGHCSSIEAEVSTDGSSGETWGQTGCYHNSDTLTVGRLQTLSTGTHTVRFDQILGESGIYFQTFFGVPIEKANIPPSAEANGPYSGSEGSAVNFNASGSIDPDGDPLQYRWDFQNDGTWDTDWSDSPSSSYTWNDDWSGMVLLQISDGEDEATDTASVVVNNVAPTVEAGPDKTDHDGVVFGFSGDYGEPGLGDVVTIRWDFGDGGVAVGTLTPTHEYAETGIYDVVLTVSDDDGGVGTDTLTVTITPTSDLTPTPTSTPIPGVIYVDCDNSTGIEDGTAAHPFDTIKEGIDAAHDGYSVLVSDGTYCEYVTIKSGIVLQGASATTTKIIGTVSMNGDGVAEINGFTVSGSATCGVHCSGSSSLIVRNNVIVANAHHGVGCFDYATPTIENNTIVYNVFEGIGVEHSSSPTIVNNIIANNARHGIWSTTFGSPVIEYNNIWHNETGDYGGCGPGLGCVSVNPAFIDPENGDYHLQTNSPCIDAGNPSSDYSIEPVPNGDRVNMGAYGNTQEAGLTLNAEPDEYEPDDTSQQATLISTQGISQTHNFEPAGDKDWIAFDATLGKKYTIETSGLADNSDTCICLYGTDGMSDMTCDDDGGAGKGSKIEWTCLKSGTYYVLIWHGNSEVHGAATQYDVSVHESYLWWIIGGAAGFLVLLLILGVLVRLFRG